MDLADAPLMLMTESAGYPGVARLAESAYLELVSGRPAPHQVLSALIREGSDKGVLLDLRLHQLMCSRDLALAQLSTRSVGVGPHTPTSSSVSLSP